MELEALVTHLEALTEALETKTDAYVMKCARIEEHQSQLLTVSEHMTRWLTNAEQLAAEPEAMLHSKKDLPE
eukprot:CAMPEP_0177688028 /NCGR_PEP_ID=MMETSP0447-20121125/34445_1 /TAXON_ID=0 /ORGANISM="Stygamoeba regulata, Strain BSH-02190019" /LENGTH=71 /DNA_ID=CAMNT_0019198313 /DNA_START=54 /DNA_END=269 /DNA_ORIENTATION=-